MKRTKLKLTIESSLFDDLLNAERLTVGQYLFEDTGLRRLEEPIRAMTTIEYRGFREPRLWNEHERADNQLWFTETRLCVLKGH